MPQNGHENALGQAIDQLVYELGFSSHSRLWDEAGETANRAAWYKRVAPGSKARTTEKHLTKLIQGLERNGHKLSQEQKDRLYAAIGVKVLKKEELDRTHRLEALKDPDRQHLLDSRRARFVPGTRHTEIADVLKLIEQLKSTGGYLTITGRAGEGKTTLVAQLIVLHFGREQTAYHIIPFNPGPDHQVTLLHSMMASLALKHPYLSDFWTQNFHRDSLAGTFTRMLKDISAKGELEVLFIDGLDQIKPDAGMQERDLNFLPLEVPKGIVIVVSTRPDDTLKPLQLRSPLCKYELPKLKRIDVDRILARYEVHLAKEVVDQFYRVTHQNALYVDLVAKELTRPGTETLRPQELLRRVSDNQDNIFSFSIERLKQPNSAWKTVIKPILGLLLVAQESVSTPAIGRILALEDEDLQDGLRRLGGLVEEDGQGKHYLYHLKFREYLREDKSSPSKGSTISQQELRLRHKQLADWCASTDPHGGKTIWKDTKDTTEQERRPYARQYYIRHLYEAQEWQHLFAVLDEGAYGRAKIDHVRALVPTHRTLTWGGKRQHGKAGN